ncbi:MAG: hypothetical protein K2J18_05565 [Paramuribaculum sp.]|nr:hypothetical protein [Paramuribaculum sp.]
MRYWVFTSKPEHFRMAEALIPGETLDWPTFSRFRFEVGDLVFIYMSNPVSQLVGKLEIEEIISFGEANPRNDLRKWPMRHSHIPWMRLRVLQSASVPFKPLQRGSLYYHTEFKPSPYPKLLHDGEKEYVMRAFGEAMRYDADMVRNEGGVEAAALERVTRGDLLREALVRLKGGYIENLDYERGNDRLTLTITAGDDRLTLILSGLIRCKWNYEKIDNAISGIRLSIEDTYLLLTIDGAEAEILTTHIEID